MHVRVAGELDPARVDDNQPGAGDDPLLDARSHHRVGLGGVRAGEQEDAGAVEVLERIGASAEAIRGDESRGRRRMTDAGAVVDVVRPHRDAHQLLHQVVLLVRPPRRGDRGDRVRPVLVADPQQLGGDMAQGVVPGRLDQLAAAPDQRAGEPIGRTDEAVGEATLDAGVAAIHRTLAVRLHERDRVIPGVDVEGAADPAVTARRRRDPLDGLRIEESRLAQRAARAAVDARAA